MMINMKKTLALTLLFLFLLSSVCMAYQPDPSKWGWICSNDEFGVFYDKTTIQHYTGSTDRCDVWIMHVYPAQNQHWIGRCMIYKNRTVKLIQFIKYDDLGHVIDSGDYSSSPPTASIIPDSIGEAIYKYFYR